MLATSSRALSIYEKKYGRNHLRVGQVLTNMGIAASYLDLHHDALRYLSRALKISLNIHGENNDEVATGTDEQRYRL